MTEFLGTTKNGVRVYDRENSHLTAHPVEMQLLAEAISKITLKDEFHLEEVEMGRTIGISNCVPTTSEDEIVYLQREGREGLTRFVKNRKGVPTSKIVVILLRKEGWDNAILLTAFIGKKAEREPWDKALVPGSEEHIRACEFWNTHALIC